MGRRLGQWLAAYRTPLLLAPLVFALLALAASVHARLTQQPTLLLITAWVEWFVALLLLPFPILALAGRWLRRRVPAVRRARVHLSYALALAVFALDLLFRAALRLGWDPYFGY